MPALRQTTQDVLLRADRRRSASRIRRCSTSGSAAVSGGHGLSIEPLFEVYNLLNENGSLTEVEQVGAALGRISRNIDGRLVRFSVKVGF